VIAVKGAFLCTAGMVILGASVSISRLILDYPVLTGQAARYALAAGVLILLAALVRRRGRAGPAVRPGRRDLAVLVALAATGLVAFNLLLLGALRHADAPVVGTVVGAAPLGLALLGPMLTGGRPRARLVAAAGVVVAGTAVVHGGGHATPAGLLAALGALAGEILFSLLAAAVLPRLGALRVSAFSCALAVPMLLLAALAVGEPARWRPPTAVEAAALGYLALALTVGAFLAWFSGLRRLGVERAGIFVGILPVATLAATAVQDVRPPDPTQLAGVLIVAAGLTLGLLSPALSTALRGADRVGVAEHGAAQGALRVLAPGDRLGHDAEQGIAEVGPGERRAGRRRHVHAAAAGPGEHLRGQ
jgi:drug/metabolite transporter (DMT)-like permease